MKLIPLQTEVLSSEKEITIIATGCGSGRTTALYQVALHKEDNGFGFTFVFTTHDKAVVAFREFRRKYGHKEGLKNVQVRYLKLERFDGVKIRFTSYRDYIDGNLLCEDIDKFPKGVIDFGLEVVRVYCTTTPDECGWRNPKLQMYKKGELVNPDGTSGTQYSATSWDSDLIDWREGATQALVGDYKPFVKVITGYSYKDNPFLEKSYVDCVQALPETEENKELFKGDWRL